MPTTGGLILDRNHILAFEEEPTFGNRAATPFTNPVYIRPISGQITETHEMIKLEIADGRRAPQRKQVQTKVIEWTMQIEIHPKLFGWFLKWTFGNMVDAGAGLYRFTSTDVDNEVRSFTIYVDNQKPDFWETGGQTLTILGAKIGRLRAEANGTGNDLRVLVDLEGMAQKPLTTTADVIDALAPLNYTRTLLASSVEPTPYLFKQTQPQLAATDDNTWKRYAIEITNQLVPRRYATEVATPVAIDYYPDDIFLGTQMIIGEFDKDFVDAMTAISTVKPITDFRGANDIDMDLRLSHTASRTPQTSPNNYEIRFSVPRYNIDEISALESFGGGDAVTETTFTGEGLTQNPTIQTVHSGSSTSIDLDINTTYSPGSSGDAEAHAFTLTAGDKYLTKVVVDLKTSTVGSEQIQAAIYTSAGTVPNVAPGGAVPKSLSNTIPGEMLTTSFQAITFLFPNHPKLTGSTEYWFVIYTTGGGTANIDIQGVATGGTNTHAVTTDGGQTWLATDPAEQWNLAVHYDDISIAVELYTEAASLFPDAT